MANLQGLPGQGAGSPTASVGDSNDWADYDPWNDPNITSDVIHEMLMENEGQRDQQEKRPLWLRKQWARYIRFLHALFVFMNSVQPGVLKDRVSALFDQLTEDGGMMYDNHTSTKRYRIGGPGAHPDDIHQLLQISNLLPRPAGVDANIYARIHRAYIAYTGCLIFNFGNSDAWKSWRILALSSASARTRALARGHFPVWAVYSQSRDSMDAGIPRQLAVVDKQPSAAYPANSASTPARLTARLFGFDSLDAMQVALNNSKTAKREIWKTWNLPHWRQEATTLSILEEGGCLWRGPGHDGPRSGERKWLSLPEILHELEICNLWLYNCHFKAPAAGWGPVDRTVGADAAAVGDTPLQDPFSP